MSGQPTGVRRHGEDERGVEGKKAGRIGLLRGDFGGEESASDGESGVVGECKNAGLDGGVAVERNIGGPEAVEEEINGGRELGGGDCCCQQQKHRIVAVSLH